MRRVPKHPAAACGVALMVLLLAVAACAPASAPTATPTRASAPASAPTTAASSAATKPAGTASTSPTTAAAKPTGKPIVACYLSPLTGPMATLGLPQSVAVQMAVDDINNSGGINGSPLKMLVQDSPFDAQQSVTLFRECAEKDNAVEVFGAYSSGEFDQEGPLSDNLKIPVVGASTTKVGGAQGHPYAFRMSIPDDVSISAAVQAFKKAYPNVKKVAIIGDVKEAVVEPVTRQLFPQYLKQNGFDVVGTSEFTRGMTDMSAVVTKAKEMNPDGLAVDGLPPEWMLLSKELARQGVNLPTVSGTHPWPGNSVYAVKDTVQGWITAAFFQQDVPGAAQQAWVKRFLDTANAESNIPKPVYASLEPQMYDAIMFSAQALRDAKITGDTPVQQVRDTIRNALENMKDYQGITRTYTMDKTLHDASGAVYPVVAKNGAWDLIKSYPLPWPPAQ